MKKIALMVLACAAILGVTDVKAQEVTYVEDCTQGVLLNRMKDNWFITAQGGASWYNSNHDTHAPFKDRIGGQVGLFVGKWFTPVFGFRMGASAMYLKGSTLYDGYFIDQKKNPLNSTEGYFPEKVMGVGPEIDMLLNLTNWWCGYKKDRVYNAVAHVGGGGYWTFRREQDGNDYKFKNAHNRTLFANLGLQNNFAVSKQVDLFIDVQYTVLNYTVQDNHKYDMVGYLGLQAGFTYKFKKRDWDCPVTAVCPTWKYTDAEGDALVAKLASANNKINDLQRQLDECLNRRVDCDCTNALATVYFPINVSSLSSREKTLVQSIANIMKQNPDKKYILTGWADNYTGNDKINTRLRNERVNSVKKCLVKAGVPESQIETRIDANNLTDFGAKGAQFDRAVTIVEAK